jgi:hypothetical protein
MAPLTKNQRTEIQAVADRQDVNSFWLECKNKGEHDHRTEHATALRVRNWPCVGVHCSRGLRHLHRGSANVMLSVMLSSEELRAPMREAQGTQDLPAFARFVFAHPRAIFGFFLVISAATLVSAIGLLKRKNWARLIFIAIMVLGITWNLGGLILPFYMFSTFVPSMPEHTPQDFRDSFEMTWKVMTAFTVLIALVFASLFRMDHQAARVT